jgi:hypothetical protein
LLAINNDINSVHSRVLKKFIPILLIAFFQSGFIPVFSQDRDSTGTEKKNRIHLNLGLIHTRLIDDGYSRNLLFRGTNCKFGLGYGRETKKYSFNFLIEGSVGKVKSKSSHLPSDFYTVQPSLEYSRKLKEHLMWGKQNAWWAGLSVSSLNYYMINEPVFDNASILSLHGLYATVGNRLYLDEKQYLHFTYRLPAVVYINRLLWNGGASDLTYSDQEHLLKTLTTRGSFTYFDIFNNVQLDASYTRHVGKGADFVLFYRFKYLSPPTELPVHLYSNEFLMSLKIYF